MIRPAERERDNAALCALARLCPQGRRLRFYHERTDYWERGRLQPRLDVQVAEEAGELTAAVSVARKELWIDGVRETAAYVHDLMVRPDRRGRGLGRGLIRAVREGCPEARLLYCYVVEDNDASRRLFEAEGFVPYPKRLLYHAMLPGLSRMSPGVDLWSDPENALEQRMRAQRDFVDPTDWHDGLFVLKRDRRTAWAQLRRMDTQVFVAMPWPLALAAKVVPLIPSPGRPVRTWALHHVGHDEVILLRRLVRGVAWKASRAGVDAVVVPLFEDDPLTATVRALTLTGWGVAPGVARLYVAGEAAGKVLGASRPLALNPQDA